MTGRGVLAVDARSGRPLWHYNKIANGTANIPSVIVDGDHIFASTGYGDGGSVLLQITASDIKELKYYSDGDRTTTEEWCYWTDMSMGDMDETGENLFVSK